MNYEEEKRDEDTYEAAYSAVAHAMTMTEDLDQLAESLRCAYIFVSEELEDMPAKAAELGLDK